MTTSRTSQLRRWLPYWAVLLMVCSGCKSIMSPVAYHPRSLDELYQEALCARQLYPENTTTPYEGDMLPNGEFGPLPELPMDGGYPIETIPPSYQSQSPSGYTGIQLVNATTLQPGGGPKVSDIFEDTDIRQAIQSLATQAGVSVIIDERVGGVTTAFIENEPFEQALRKVLLPLGLISRKEGGQYLVGSTDPESAMFPILSETIEYRPENLSPVELLTMLSEREQRYVRVIAKRNVMIIQAPHLMASQIAQRLYQADEPVPQVVLEAIVCVFSPEKSFQYNLDASHGVEIGGSDVLNLGLTGLALTGNGSPIGVSEAFTDFAVTSTFLRLLAQEGYVTIRAAPRVMAKDGEKATINISRESFFSTSPERADIVFSQNIQQVDAGISLDIIPVVRGDNVTVEIEKAEVSENITTSDSSDNLVSPFPLINRRQVSTTVHVKDGHTIVIGGLVQRQTIDRISEVPYLCDIPGFGKLFQRIEQEDMEAEVAIFISPKIIRAPSRKREPIHVDVHRDVQRTPEPANFPGPTLAPVNEPVIEKPPAPVSPKPTVAPAPKPTIQPATPVNSKPKPSKPPQSIKMLAPIKTSSDNWNKTTIHKKPRQSTSSPAQPSSDASFIAPPARSKPSNRPTSSSAPIKRGSTSAIKNKPQLKMLLPQPVFEQLPADE